MSFCYVIQKAAAPEKDSGLIHSEAINAYTITLKVLPPTHTM